MAPYTLRFSISLYNFSGTCKSVECGLSATVMEQVANAKFSGATYKYAPAGKGSAPGRSGPSVELPVTVNCLFATCDALPVIDRWHLTMFIGLPVTVISHLATFNALPVTVISHPETFNALPVIVN